MGNFSRDTFDKLKHYVGVRLQQGVPLVDADWNEQEDIRKYELRAFLKWFVGNGVPKGNDGFRIQVIPLEAIPAENDFWIKGGDGTPDGAGRCLVEGWDVMNENDIKYTKQPLYNNDALAGEWGVDPLPPLKPPKENEEERTDTVYLDVWEREVDAEEDNEHLVNPKIGIETCVRLKREWVVRVEGAETPPDPPSGHVYYPLATLNRVANKAAIEQEDITDLRTTSLNMAALEAEIVDARGIKGNIGNRLDESLTKGGQLRHNVVGNDQVKADAAIEESKILFSASGHDHGGGEKGQAIGSTGLADSAVTTVKIADTAIRTSKIKRDAVTNDKIQNEAVDYYKMQFEKIADGQIAMEEGDVPKSFPVSTRWCFEERPYWLIIRPIGETSGGAGVTGELIYMSDPASPDFYDQTFQLWVRISRIEALTNEKVDVYWAVRTFSKGGSKRQSMSKKALILQSLKEAGVLDSDDEKIKAFIVDLRERRGDSWRTVFSDFREKFYECFDDVVPAISEIDDPLIRLALIHFLDASQPKERKLLEKFAAEIVPEQEPIAIKHLARKNVPQVNTLLARRSLPETLSKYLG